MFVTFLVFSCFFLPNNPLKGEDFFFCIVFVMGSDAVAVSLKGICEGFFIVIAIDTTHVQIEDALFSNLCIKYL